MRNDLEVLAEVLGVDVDADLLVVALTHRSFAYENGGLPTNERLEFLGDAVLSIVVTETLYTQYPAWSEGQLAKMRAAVVNANALADVARTLGVGEHPGGYFLGLPGNPAAAVVTFALFGVPFLRALAGDSGARALIGAHPEAVCEVELGPSVLLDVDTPADLASLRR